ncbi:acetyltransferase [Desulfosporosinus acidiphilus SJ4]|uniref:Acetyltransferase n=1 Tax=Desulfosporosinus acidiphilus (strain DSM 22704 / JCM 16185 / SJ4) TaxID=646529 RepID=I4D1R6_DESAJ|nr:GNAT family N-acetyltransferase [Desulfosporosinus acidiphilus]AFM39740.1 acetyltransferase [Desulfosporosinus acidiphilus SJ4]
MPTDRLNYINCKCEVNVEHLKARDIPIVAQLYMRSFQNHFLGHMGQKFLMLFISEFVNSRGNFGYVATFKNEAIGFILASTSENPFRNFYRDNFISLVCLTISGFLKDAFIRKHLKEKFGHIFLALKALVSFSEGSIDHVEMKGGQPRLLAIAVDRSYRGLGIASDLTAEFCKEMKELGYEEAGLSALPWNKRAIRFYIKDGWKEEESTENSISFSRIL